MWNLLAAISAASSLWSMSSTAQPVAQAATASPQPVLRFTNYIRYRASGREFVRYSFEVVNRAAFSAELFTPSPGLPPCGSNASSARSWVDIFRADSTRIYGFCALASPDMLGQLWFALPLAEARPASIYIEIKDRLTNRVHRSAPTALPNLPVQPSEREVGTIGRWRVIRTSLGQVSCDMRGPNNGIAHEVMVGGAARSSERFIAFSKPGWELPQGRVEIGVSQGGREPTRIWAVSGGSEVRMAMADLDEIVRNRAGGSMQFWLNPERDRSPDDMLGSYIVDPNFVRAYDEVKSCLAAG